MSNRNRNTPLLLLRRLINLIKRRVMRQPFAANVFVIAAVNVVFP
jgi:hypothetical protein